MKKTRTAKSLICLIMAFVMILSSAALTSCQKAYDWTAEAEEVLPLGIDVSKSEGHYTVTLTSDSDVFSENIPREAVKIDAAYLIEADDADTESSGEASLPAEPGNAEGDANDLSSEDSDSSGEEVDPEAPGDTPVVNDVSPDTKPSDEGSDPGEPGTPPDAVDAPDAGGEPSGGGADPEEPDNPPDAVGADGEPTDGVVDPIEPDNPPDTPDEDTGSSDEGSEPAEPGYANDLSSEDADSSGEEAGPAESGDETETNIETPPVPEYFEEAVTSFKIARESAKKLVITFDAEADYQLMTVGVHKSVMTNNLFGDAFWREGSEPYLAPSASISGEFNVYDKNPTLTIVLKNTTATDNFSADMVSLDGAFRDLTVTEVAVDGDTLTITTTGTINDLTSHAKVTLKPEATHAALPLDAFATVTSVGAAVIPESYRLVGGHVEFRVQLSNLTFTKGKDDVAAAIAGDGLNIGVKEAGKDYAILTTPTTAATLDEALETLDGTTLTIAGSVLSSGRDINDLILNATGTELKFTVDYVSQEEDGTYRADGILYTLYGDTPDLTPKDLTFGGDFTGAAVQSLERNVDSYSVVFTFEAPYEGFVLEDAELNGTLAIPEGTIKNRWGTNADRVCAYSYSHDNMDRDVGNFAEALAQFVGSFDSSLTDLQRWSSRVNGVANVANGIFTVLQFTGAIESGESTQLKEISKTVQRVSERIDELSVKMDNIRTQVIDNISSVSKKMDESTFINVSNYWNTFMGTYAGDLKKLTAAYNEDYRANIVRFLSNPSETQIKIYVDTSGNVTVPGVTDVRSPEGKEIAKIYTFTGNKAGVSSLTAEMIANGTLNRNYRTWNNGFDAALQEGFSSHKLLNLKSLTLLKVEETAYDNANPELTPLQLYYGFTNYFAQQALEKVGAINVLNAYAAFSEQLGGAPGTTRGAIDDFYSIISLYYNFYSEAESDINQMRAYLMGLAVNANKLALIAEAQTTMTNTVSQINYKLKSTIRKKAPGEGQQRPAELDWPSSDTAEFSFVTNSWIWLDIVRNWNTPKVGVSEQDIYLMYNRYDKLNKANIGRAHRAEDFFDYLSGADSEVKRWVRYIVGRGTRNIAIKTEVSSFSPDDGQKLSLYAELQPNHKRAYYFNNGELNVIDTSGRRKKQYYHDLLRLDTTFFDPAGATTKKVLTYASGWYEERHSYWVSADDEVWRFFRTFFGDSGFYVLQQ